MRLPNNPRDGVLIREATLSDATDIQALYADHVRDGTATFETVPPSCQEMADRIAAVQARRLPYLVARQMENGPRPDPLLGYAYLAPFRSRAAYAHTVEDSIYLAPDAVGKGLGTRLLTALMDAATARGGLHQIVAVISDPGGAASVALHRRLGFETIGTLARVGHKHGRWLDTIYMQRTIARP